ncbi:hypothetical protein [Nocardioides euryhalodurans]|uniref:Peptidase S26 domain-containing protein n=1 Tax=Nocardioides euryhalodurans TaxID=2518370 RepID=A0A4P7GNF2_9ACTN|nr:hypothetical protein [Nocardioides euryhalodurans]QBR93738.1 hypothetical protein EXE57_16740 [Nocardioides euryhalodurans]
MEITTRPRSHRWRRWGARLWLVTILMAVGLLVPAALGLSQDPVADDTMAGSLDRGSLVFGRPVRAVEGLAVGDVISFRAPPPGSREMVTRRVVAIDGGQVWTRGDAVLDPDPWVLQGNTAEPVRVVFALPLAGYPQLLMPWLTWAVVALLLSCAAVAVSVLARRQAGRERVVTSPGRDRAPAVA